MNSFLHLCISYNSILNTLGKVGLSEASEKEYKNKQKQQI